MFLVHINVIINHRFKAKSTLCHRSDHKVDEVDSVTLNIEIMTQFDLINIY